MLDGLEQRHRDAHLLHERRLLRVAERHEQQIGGHERGLLRLRDPDRRGEDRRVERGAGERDEDPPRAGLWTPPQTVPAQERSRQHGDDRREQGDRRDHGSAPLAVGPVRDHADVEARQLAHHAREQRAAEDLAPARLVGRADEDVRRAALGGDAADGADEVVALLLEEVRAEDPGQAAQRGELGRLLPRRRLPGRPDPEHVHLRPEPLGGAERAPEDALRLRLRLDQREHPLGDGLLAQRLQRLRDPARLDVLGDLAQRQLAQGGELVGAEEVVERDLGALRRVHLPRPQPRLQLLRRQVDEDHLVRVLEHAVREGLAHAHLGQLEDRVVQALEMLDVDGRDHVDPGRRAPRAMSS